MNNSSKNLSEEITLVDRISNLPDKLLCHILSFLPTKQAVVTSVLSRRWEFLWTYVDILDFDYKFPRNDEIPGKMQFSQFVNRVMQLHRATRIKSMRLRCNGNECNEYYVVTWIRTAVFREVQILDLHLSFNVKWPLCFFYSQTLAELTLSFAGIMNMNIPTAPFFPNLKKLNLTYLHLSPCKLERFISGCSALECLFLVSSKCIATMVSRHYISSATLKKFDYHCRVYCVNPQLVLNTPALEFIKIWDIKNLELLGKSNMSSLREAHVPFDLNQFCYLKCLPNVEVLSLTCLNTTGGIWEEPECVPECLSSSLYTIYIKGYENEEEVELMIKYILANAKVLKRMEIHTSDSIKDCELKFHMVQKITMFPRASGICELLFF